MRRARSRAFAALVREAVLQRRISMRAQNAAERARVDLDNAKETSRAADQVAVQAVERANHAESVLCGALFAAAREGVQS